MAESKEIIATCPICGLQDTSNDGPALEAAMQSHVREAHNLAYPLNNTQGDIKDSDQVKESEVTDILVVPDAPITGVSSNIPGIGPDLGGATYR